MPGREHVPEGGQNTIEAAVLEGKILGVALTPFDLETFGLRASLSRMEQAWSEVKSRYLCAEASRSAGRISGAARHIEHPGAAFDASLRDHEFAHIGDIR
jgi:hypothetical protein